MSPSLQTVFGPPSQAGFSSAVFADQVDRAQDLEAAALRCYRRFLGKRWAEAGEATWMAVWRRTYVRKPGDSRGILAELPGIADPEIRSSVTVLLDGHDNPDAGRRALSAECGDGKPRGVYAGRRCRLVRRADCRLRA